MTIHDLVISKSRLDDGRTSVSVRVPYGNGRSAELIFPVRPKFSMRKWTSYYSSTSTKSGSPLLT
jgi:hypothetical protein